MMTPEREREIQEMLGKITPGPWEYWIGSNQTTMIANEKQGIISAYWSEGRCVSDIAAEEEDLYFIAASPEIVKECLDTIREMRERAEKAESLIKQIHSVICDETAEPGDYISWCIIAEKALGLKKPESSSNI
jgi:hypothetical protein